MQAGGLFRFGCGLVVGTVLFGASAVTALAQSYAVAPPPGGVETRSFGVHATSHGIASGDQEVSRG